MENAKMSAGGSRDVRSGGTEIHSSIRFRSSVLLFFGFAALLLLVSVSAVLSWRTAIRAQEAVQHLHGIHVQAGQALSEVRSNVYLSAVLVRDYLIDPDPNAAQQYQAQFQEIRDSTATSFAVLDALAQDDQQRRALAALRVQIEAYWDPTEIALDWTPEQKAERRVRVLRQKVKKRNEIFTLSRDLERLISSNVQRERSRVAAAQAYYRRLLGISTTATVFIGIAVALFTMFRVARLERASEKAADDLRLLSSELRTAQEDERKHLSRELHDQIGQMLTGLKMELTSLYRRRLVQDTEVVAGIDRAKATVEQILRTVRNIAMLLRPSMLDDLGLAPALNWHVREFTRVSGIQAVCEMDEHLADLPETYSTCLYRVVQEALTNCARYSQARTICVRVSSTREAVRVSVRDDGVGFDRKLRTRPGLGLLGMAERVRELGGQMTVTSQPGQGTNVEVVLPLAGETSTTNAESCHSGRPRDSTDGVKAPA